MTGLPLATLRGPRLDPRAPADDGRLELTARRPAIDQRELLMEAVLDSQDGLLGDGWCVRPSSAGPGGGPAPDAQVTIMNARAAALMAGGDDRARWAPEGNQLHDDLDIDARTRRRAGRDRRRRHRAHARPRGDSRIDPSLELEQLGLTVRQTSRQASAGAAAPRARLHG